jgi:hypothetical protein
MSELWSRLIKFLIMSAGKQVCRACPIKISNGCSQKKIHTDFMSELWSRLIKFLIMSDHVWSCLIMFDQLSTEIVWLNNNNNNKAKCKPGGTLRVLACKNTCFCYRTLTSSNTAGDDGKYVGAFVRGQEFQFSVVHDSSYTEIQDQAVTIEDETTVVTMTLYAKVDVSTYFGSSSQHFRSAFW